MARIRQVSLLVPSNGKSQVEDGDHHPIDRIEAEIKRLQQMNAILNSKIKMN